MTSGSRRRAAASAASGRAVLLGPTGSGPLSSPSMRCSATLLRARAAARPIVVAVRCAPRPPFRRPRRRSAWALRGGRARAAAPAAWASGALGLVAPLGRIRQRSSRLPAGRPPTAGVLRRLCRAWPTWPVTARPASRAGLGSARGGRLGSGAPEHVGSRRPIALAALRPRARRVAGTDLPPPRGRWPRRLRSRSPSPSSSPGAGASRPPAAVEGAGVELAWSERGAGPVVLLVHGLASGRADAGGRGRRPGATSRAWSATTAAATAPAARPSPYGGTPVEEQAEDAAAVLAAAGGGAAVAAGFGALVALDLLRRHRGLVRAVALADPPLFKLVPEATRGPRGDLRPPARRRCGRAAREPGWRSGWATTRTPGSSPAPGRRTAPLRRLGRALVLAGHPRRAAPLDGPAVSSPVRARRAPAPPRPAPGRAPAALAPDADGDLAALRARCCGRRVRRGRDLERRPRATARPAPPVAPPPPRSSPGAGASKPSCGSSARTLDLVWPRATRFAPGRPRRRRSPSARACR